MDGASQDTSCADEPIELVEADIGGTGSSSRGSSGNPQVVTARNNGSSGQPASKSEMLKLDPDSAAADGTLVCTACGSSLVHYHPPSAGAAAALPSASPSGSAFASPASELATGTSALSSRKVEAVAAAGEGNSRSSAADSLELSLKRIEACDACAECKARWRKEEEQWWAAGGPSSKHSGSEFSEPSKDGEDGDSALPMHRRTWLPPAVAASWKKAGLTIEQGVAEPFDAAEERSNSQDFVVDVPKRCIFTMCDVRRHSAHSATVASASTAASTTQGVVPSPAAASSSVTGGVWLTAKGVVYNVTPFLSHHPGGIQSLVKRSGMEADRDFDFHSEAAQRLWARYAIGKLGPCKGRPHIKVVGGNGPHGGGGGCTIA